jgi:phosphatidate cytidylyltransferase
MLTRIISGVIAFAILTVIIFLPSYALVVTVFAASAIGLLEFSKALKNKNISIDLPVSIISAFAIVVKTFLVTLPDKPNHAFVGFLSGLFRIENLNTVIYLIIVYFFIKIIYKNGRCRIEDMAYTLFAIIYIPFLLSFVVSLRNLERGLEYVWLVIIGSSLTDIFAYFIGTLFGKTKIIPHISPKKTVEGSIGGVIGCMIVMVLYGAVVMNRPGVETISLYHFAFLGFLCGIVSQVGDWAASAIKRSTGIKDFGRLIPGHGGILDRVDSILFVAPLVYIYVSYF